MKTPGPPGVHRDCPCLHHLSAEADRGGLRRSWRIGIMLSELGTSQANKQQEQGLYRGIKGAKRQYSRRMARFRNSRYRDYAWGYGPWWTTSPHHRSMSAPSLCWMSWMTSLPNLKQTTDNSDPCEEYLNSPWWPDVDTVTRHYEVIPWKDQCTQSSRFRQHTWVLRDCAEELTDVFMGIYKKLSHRSYLLLKSADDRTMVDLIRNRDEINHRSEVSHQATGQWQQCLWMWRRWRRL